jgi:adenylate kinase
VKCGLRWTICAHLDIDENQRVLLRSFRRALDTKDDLLTVLDGHTIVKRQEGITFIAADVFAEMGVRAIAVLTDEPAVILERREGDATRKRSVISIAELHQRQEAAHAHAKAIAASLQISLLASVLA